MKILKKVLNGACLIQLTSSQDHRGSFVKTYHNSTWQQLHLPFELKESYYSISAKNVIRGMHFQTPPKQHHKIVYCPKGIIQDVIIDLRKSSPTYGQVHTEILSGENHCAFYIPEGFAHGFLSLQEDTITHYLLSSEYAPQHDAGILYSSIGFDWEIQNPILSPRDSQFCEWTDFLSPF